MKEQKIDRIECAIRHIESSLDVDPWAVEIAVDAMEKQIVARQMLDDEKTNGISLHSEDFSKGRISAFYDVLGMDYAD